ncbi:hypothetical protein [Couchioplanes azureus]|uniref:hypothetical protein n=1 Tax=Couchioplanes caeruleus TaxID=56438 RepID=UPI00166FEAC1|nr:hypothetical protein [Couchioplanes caeruleus]GGQ58909.1 hypothetical protein GCM10010166_30410 [Couchioplanes caeruleus subsp. azureus]
MLWRDVFVPSHVVAGDGFTAEVGGVAELPLALFCRYRAGVGAEHRRTAVTSTPGSRSDPGHRRIYDLVGSVVPAESRIWPDGWMLDVGGLGMYVSEADASPSPRMPGRPGDREAGSDPALPVPRPGTWLRVRGQLGIAEPYETDGFAPEAELRDRAVRAWTVRRITRLDGAVGGPGPAYRGQGHDVPVMRRADLRHGGRGSTVGYLLDLALPQPGE